RPAGYGLQPRSIGELLDLGFAIYRRRFPVFAAIGIPVSLAGTILSDLWQADLVSSLNESSEPPQVFTAAFVARLASLMAVFLTLHGMGCMAVTAATEEIFLGRPVTARTAVAKSWRRTVPAACAAILCAIFAAMGFLLCCLPGIAVTAMLILAVPLVY